MKIPVNITIMTNKTVDDPQDGGNRCEVRETTVNGFMHTKKNGLTLEYAEPEEGSVPVTTLIDLQRSGIVMMNRGGDAGIPQGHAPRTPAEHGLLRADRRPERRGVFRRDRAHRLHVGSCARR